MSIAHGHIGRYELLSRIGAGGMGEIYLARTTGAGGFEKHVVIKRILPHLAEDPDFVRRFIEEGKLVVQLRHANIAQVLDMNEEGGTTFIAMEHVDGKNLAELMRFARSGGVATPLPIAISVLVRVLEALDYAHRATSPDGTPLGIIHRDVSPANVMVSRTGEVKLLDFGIAKATERVDTSISGAIRGKYNYMSPQQAEGRPLDGRTDLFSVGVMAWEMLTGARPFDGESDVLTLDRIRYHDPGSLRDHADVPQDVADVVDRLLAKDPDERWPTADDAVRALQACLVRSGSLPSARELAEWVERILDTLPPALRARQGAPLSLDEALRLGLEQSGNVGPGTISAPVDGAFARTQTDGTPSSPVGSVRAGTPPRPSTPAAVALPLDAPAEGASTDERRPRVITVTVPAGRKRTALLITLVALNLALLFAVGWLVLRVTDDDAPASIPAARAAGALAAIGASDLPTSPRVATLAADTAGGDVAAAAADTIQALPPSTAGEGAGSAIAAASDVIFRDDVTLRFSTRPAEARLFTRPDGGARVTVRRGTNVLVSASADGYDSLSRSYVAETDDLHVLTLTRSAPTATGAVTFRVRPAQGAVVTIDGEAVRTNGQGIVLHNLAPGDHTVLVVADCKVSRRFNVSAGPDPRSLGTLDATCPPEDAP